MFIANFLLPEKTRPVVTPDPDNITVFKNWTRLTTDQFGVCSGREIEGLYCANTQLVSEHRILINGRPLERYLAAKLSPTDWAMIGSVKGSSEEGDLPEGHRPRSSTQVTVHRSICNGLTELIRVHNNDVKTAIEIHLDIELVATIEDSMLRDELKHSRPSTQMVKPASARSAGKKAAVLCKRNFGKAHSLPASLLHLSKLHEGTDIVRGFKLTSQIGRHRFPCKLTVKPGGKTVISAVTMIPPQKTFELWNFFDLLIDGYTLKAPRTICYSAAACSRNMDAGIDPKFSSASPFVDLLVSQAQKDLKSLRLALPWHSTGKREGITAGIPRYIGVFGRDTLISGWQEVLFDHSKLKRDINLIGSFQGRKWENWREEEPGRLPHEQRLDPGSLTGKINRALYYGDVTSTPFFAIALSTYLMWTGDLAFAKSHERTLIKCCRWILDRLRAGNGFIFYQPPQGLRKDVARNQAWKDSGDAIVDDIGEICAPPLALCEIQGYAHRALIESVNILKKLNSDANYSSWEDAAGKLKEDFNRYFWIPGEKMYGLAVQGPDFRLIKAIASNAGHCLGTDIIPPERVKWVVRRLLKPDMFSGWGIRTLASSNPAYDPFSYHRGSIWPVENAEIANGMALREHFDESNLVIEAQMSLATVYTGNRLPEVVTGHSNTEFPVPGLYPFANMLQAWSASAICQFVQTMTGIYARADENIILIRPHLPDWLPEVTLRDIRFAHGGLDLKFERRNGQTRFEVLRKKGRFVVDGC